LVDGFLGLLTVIGTVSPVLHYLWPTRLFSLTVFALRHRVEEEAISE
jgi:hypothetical protein